MTWMIQARRFSAGSPSSESMSSSDRSLSAVGSLTEWGKNGESNMVKGKEPKFMVNWEGIELGDIFFGLLLGLCLLISKYRMFKQGWKDEDGL